MHNFNIVDLFSGKAKLFPDAIAIIYRHKKTTFQGLANSVDETAQYFLQKGIQKNDRVLVFIPMSDDLYRVVLALFKIGATAVFLDEWVSIERLNACCRLAECRALVGSPKVRLLAWFVPGLRRIPLRLGLRCRRPRKTLPLPETTADDVALITFTTGSTGTPKAAIRTHGLLCEQFRALDPVLGLQPGEVCLAALPIVLLINLAAGVTSVIADFKGRKMAALKPEKITAQLRAHSVECLIASPFFVRKIAEHLLAEKADLPKLTKVFTGGAPVFPAEARLFLEAFPSTRTQVVYGSTEAEPISTIAARTLAAILTDGLPVGRPEAVAQVKIIKIIDAPIAISSGPELAKLEMKPGEIGEIIVSGQHVLREYLHNVAALRRNKIFVGDQCWHRTGDSGYLDRAGNLFLTGRCGTLIHRAGQVLSPFLYEARFQEMDGVEVGTVVEVNGQLVAVVETAAGVDSVDLSTALASRFGLIDKVVFTKKIPRDPRHHSKIDYERLKAELEG